jgi:hypothetical protein
MITPFREVEQVRTFIPEDFKEVVKNIHGSPWDIVDDTPEYYSSLYPAEREYLLKNALFSLDMTVDDDLKTAEQFIYYGSNTMVLSDIVHEMALKKWLREYRDLDGSIADIIRKWTVMQSREEFFVGARDFDPDELTDKQLFEKFSYMIPEAEMEVIEEWRDNEPDTWPWMA